MPLACSRISSCATSSYVAVITVPKGQTYDIVQVVDPIHQDTRARDIFSACPPRRPRLIDSEAPSSVACNDRRDERADEHPEVEPQADLDLALDHPLARMPRATPG